jgi:hypothetical protein
MRIGTLTVPHDRRADREADLMKYQRGRANKKNEELDVHNDYDDDDGVSVVSSFYGDDLSRRRGDASWRQNCILYNETRKLSFLPIDTYICIYQSLIQ